MIRKMLRRWLCLESYFAGSVSDLRKRMEGIEEKLEERTRKKRLMVLMAQAIDGALECEEDEHQENGRLLRLPWRSGTMLEVVLEDFIRDLVAEKTKKENIKLQLSDEFIAEVVEKINRLQLEKK